jgi:hypothetical protein
MKNMISRFRRRPHRIMPVCCCMILALMLVACGGGTTSTPTPAPTPQPSPTPSPTPTPSPIPTPVLKVYTGKGYSISYPKGWQVNTSSVGVAFGDATNGYFLAITVNPNPNDTISASTFAHDTLSATKTQMKNPQTETLPPTTTVGGESWVQKSISGTETVLGLSGVVQVVVISDNHPANSADTQNFTIEYQMLKSSFATATTSYFQPMLHSLKFT